MPGDRASLHRYIQGIRNDSKGLIFHPFQMPATLCRGCAWIENDGFTRLYQFCCGPSDSNFFIPVQRFFGAER